MKRIFAVPAMLLIVASIAAVFVPRISSESVVDVAVIDVTAPSYTYPGWTVNIDVTAANYGTENASFSVTLYYGSNVIGVLPVNDLEPSMTLVLHFSWDTTGVPSCANYTLKAEATILPFETNTANNTFNDGEIRIRLFADLDGNDNVDLSDAVILAAAAGSYVGHPRWNPEADLNQNGNVNVFDAVIFSRNVGTSCP